MEAVKPCATMRPMRQIKHPALDQIELTDLMHALSDPARIEIVRCLARERRPLTCNEIDLDRPKSSMSHHFKILRGAGLIRTEARGNEHYNTLRTAELEHKFPGLVKTLLKLIAGP
jgi:DNA-binding transcriptional ArsR family regulator